MGVIKDSCLVGGAFQLGDGIYPAVGVGDKEIFGSMAAEGPIVVGDPAGFKAASATVMIAKLTNDDKHCPATPTASWGVKGDMPVAAHLLGNTFIDGDVFVTGSVDCISVGRLEARHQIADGSPKLFDIPHPSRDGYRLSHACIEGPEVGVYTRGRVRNKKEIKLPDYWKDLVHVNSISVQLQPIGAHQDVIIKRWDDETIFLQARGGMPIDCFYHIYAERKDVNGLVVEYEGESWEDHPDRKGDDPKYAGQNTRTL